MRVCLKDYFSMAAETFEVAFAEDNSRLFQLSSEQQRGFFSKLSEHCAGLFSIEDRLFIYLNGTASEVDERVCVAYESNGDDRRLRIQIGASLTVIDYINTRKPVSTFFYSEDDEDADFGLWLSNVLKSDERCDIAIESWWAC